MSEIVYESRGKLIGGNLSRERTVEKLTIRNEGGDSIMQCTYWMPLPITLEMHTGNNKEASVVFDAIM